MTALVVEGLRMILDDSPTNSSSPTDSDSPADSGPRRPFPTYGTGEGRLLVDLTDRDAVYEALDADGFR